MVTGDAGQELVCAAHIGGYLGTFLLKLMTTLVFFCQVSKIWRDHQLKVSMDAFVNFTKITLYCLTPTHC